MTDKNLQEIGVKLDKLLYCYEQWLATQGVYVNYEDMNKPTKVEQNKKRRNK